MKIKMLFAVLALAASPALASAQDRISLWADLEEKKPFPSLSDPAPWTPPSASADNVAALPLFEPSARSAAMVPSSFSTELMQAEIAPRMRFMLSLFGRIDFPGTGDVTVDGDQYGDIFDIGYGLNAEGSLITWVTPHWGIGGYLSIGWDRYEGTSHFPFLSGEVFSFDTMDQVSFIAGGKLVQHVGPFFFWEGRMGVGVVHYSSLTFTDETTAPFQSGLQFFRPITRGLFDIGGRAGIGNPHVSFDIGLDFRFMGGAARGRDVSNAVDPDLFFVFALDLGLTLRF